MNMYTTVRMWMSAHVKIAGVIALIAIVAYIRQ